MFLGEYKHSIDYKGRISVPKKFREELGREAILTRGLDGCLFLYSNKSWEELTAKLIDLPITQADARAFSRYLFAGATKVDFDQLGRIAVPDYLRQYSSLSKFAVVVGVLERVEIWDQERWQKLQVKLKKSGELVAERLSRQGV
jgi:MraZ protein